MRHIAVAVIGALLLQKAFAPQETLTVAGRTLTLRQRIDIGALDIRPEVLPRRHLLRGRPRSTEPPAAPADGSGPEL